LAGRVASANQVGKLVLQVWSYVSGVRIMIGGDLCPWEKMVTMVTAE
jgi:hypothetical protein